MHPFAAAARSSSATDRFSLARLESATVAALQHDRLAARLAWREGAGPCPPYPLERLHSHHLPRVTFGSSRHLPPCAALAVVISGPRSWSAKVDTIAVPGAADL